MSDRTKVEKSANADAALGQPAYCKTDVVGSQSQTKEDYAALCSSEVVQIVRSLLDSGRELPGHLEYMRYKGLTIISKSDLNWLKWLCLIGWCLAISIFSAILLLSVQQ